MPIFRTWRYFFTLAAASVALPEAASMPKMADAGEEHGHIMLVGGRDDFGVAHRASRLNRGSRAGFGGGDEAVGKWKERIAANNAALQRKSRFACFPDRDPA